MSETVAAAVMALVIGAAGEMLATYYAGADEARRNLITADTMKAAVTVVA